MYTYAQSQVKEQLFYYFFAYFVILLHKQSRVCHFPINTVNLKYVNLRPYIFSDRCKTDHNGEDSFMANYQNSMHFV
jgi:hypothetical protein